MLPKTNTQYETMYFGVKNGKTWEVLGKPIELKVDDTDYSLSMGELISEQSIKDYLGEIEEEENMNKVLELYYERKLNNLEKFYNELEKQEYNKVEVVKEYNTINEEYTNKMEELRNKYNTSDKQFVVRTGYKDDNRYELSYTIKEDIHTELFKQYEVEKKEILKEKATIEAVLSLSEDKDYQVEVLKNYGILDKKGMMVEE